MREAATLKYGLRCIRKKQTKIFLQKWRVQLSNTLLIKLITNLHKQLHKNLPENFISNYLQWLCYFVSEILTAVDIQIAIFRGVRFYFRV